MINPESIKRLHDEYALQFSKLEIYKNMENKIFFEKQKAFLEGMQYITQMLSSDGEIWTSVNSATKLSNEKTNAHAIAPSNAGITRTISTGSWNSKEQENESYTQI